MKRRIFILGGAALTGGAAIAIHEALPPSAKMLLENYQILPRRVPVLVERQFDWRGSDFLSGGTKAVRLETLPPPLFRDEPNGVATLANIVGPCDAAGVPMRIDVSEGRSGLPMRMSLRVVDAASRRPYEGAEIQLWHANVKGLYSGRDVSAECTFDDPDAKSGLAFRGRQKTDDRGIVNFLTVYPGWYSGRCIHVHVRIVVDGKALLVSQLYFEDRLSDAIHADHPDYVGRGPRDTRNAGDSWSPRFHLNAHMFDFEKLAGGVLQASYTVGVAV